MVAMEEGGHVASRFVTAVADRLHDIASHVGCYHTYEDEVVAVGVPERRVGIVAEISLLHIAAGVDILTVAVAAQCRPHKRAVECGVEHVAIAVAATAHLDMAEQVFPCGVGSVADIVERCLANLLGKILLGILYTHERASYLQLQRIVGAIIDEAHHSDGVAVVTAYINTLHLVARLYMEIYAPLTVLIAFETALSTLLYLPATGVIVRACYIDNKFLVATLGVGVASARRSHCNARGIPDNIPGLPTHARG